MAETPRLIATTPGGAPVRSCSCVATWWPLFNRLAVARGFARVTLDISQGGYRAGATEASAGTHDAGGVLDLVQYGHGLALLAREAGAAAWFRNWPGNLHIHLVLIGCPHLAPDAADQADEYLAGGDGLTGTRPDLTARPAVQRTWTAGLAWLITQLNPPPATLEEDDMTPDQLKAIIVAALNDWARSDAGALAIQRAAWGAGTYGDPDRDGDPDRPIDMLTLLVSKAAGR